jgi:hypothetical protein
MVAPAFAAAHWRQRKRFCQIASCREKIVRVFGIKSASGTWITRRAFDAHAPMRRFRSSQVHRLGLMNQEADQTRTP